MRILSIYRHYWPDATPYARLLKPMLERFAADGHEVTVFTGQPGYNDIRQETRPRRESEKGVSIIRTPLLPERKRILVSRAANFLLFSLSAIVYALAGRRWDLVLVNSYPPVIMGLTARIIGRLLKAPYIYHCQDIHPESALIAGRIRGGGFFRLLRDIDTKNCRAAAVVVTLSEDMAGTFAKRGPGPDNVRVINNFIVETSSAATGLPAGMENRSEDVLQVLYAGNMGNFQGLEHVIEAARLLRSNTGIRFVFMGEGSAKAGLMEMSGDMLGKTVSFIPYQPVETAFAAMEEADFGLLSLKEDVYRVAYPSKTMMYYAAGCPVIAIVEDESFLARDIASAGLGYSCPQSKPEKLAGTISEAWLKRSDWRRRRDYIRGMAQDVFGRDKVLDGWSGLVREIASARVLEGAGPAGGGR